MIIDSLLKSGAQRTGYLVGIGKNNLDRQITRVKVLIILFIIISGLLLLFTTFNFFGQQKKTRKKERELETVFNRISDGVVSVNNDWHYTFLNDAALAAHPLGKKGTLGKLIWDVHPEMKGTIFWDKYHEAMDTRKVVEIEDYYAPLNTWFSVKAYPSLDGLTIFFKNVSDRKLAEQRLSEILREVNDYKFALDESSIVAITDQKGLIKHANSNFSKISKYSIEELIGQDHRIINSGFHSKEFIRSLWTTIANGKIWKGELKNRAKDGTIYWVDTTIVPFLNEQAKPYQYIAIRSDITERKKGEEEITKLNAELEEKVIRRTEELQLATNEMESFTYSVSHDLRAPLRGIIAFSKILEEEYTSKLDNEARRITSVIQQSALKMGNLIDDLLTFSRMGKQGLTKVMVNTGQLVQEIVNDQEQMNEHRHTINWEIHSLPNVNADKNTLRQVWINLISNAIKYSANKENPRIEIGSFEEGQQRVFFIRDNGAGFDDQYKDKLFKVFQRLHDADEFEGTGIGLVLQRWRSQWQGRILITWLI